MVYDYLPRVWTEETGYYYPCFSELGLTYENPNLEFNEENVQDLRFAYSWILDANKGIYFKHIVERCSGIKDKHDKLIYEGDIITKLYVTPTGELTKDLDESLEPLLLSSLEAFVSSENCGSSVRLLSIFNK